MTNQLKISSIFRPPGLNVVGASANGQGRLCRNLCWAYPLMLRGIHAWQQTSLPFPSYFNGGSPHNQIWTFLNAFLDSAIVLDKF